MKRIIVLFAICLVLTMVFVACNDPKVPDETTDANSTEVITTDTEAQTTEVEITEVETEVPTTEEVTETQAVTTEKVTTEKVTTEEVTTEVVTTEEVTTEEVTTEPVTTEAVTTPPAPPAGGGGGGNAKMMNFGKSRAKMSHGDNNINLGSVAGLKEEKEDLEEIVEFLKEPGKFTSVGARIPKGVLLVLCMRSAPLTQPL